MAVLQSNDRTIALYTHVWTNDSLELHVFLWRLSVGLHSAKGHQYFGAIHANLHR